MNILDIVRNLLVENDYQFANTLCRTFYGKTVLNVIDDLPKGARIWYICCACENDTEQLFVLRKALFDLRMLYDFIPRLENAEHMKLRGMGTVYALPVSAQKVKDSPGFVSNLFRSHKLLRLVKRRK